MWKNKIKPTLSDGKTCKGSKPWSIFDSPFVFHPATDPHLHQKKIDGAYSTMAHLNHIENYRTYDISSGIPEIKWTDVDLVDFYNVSMECVGLEIGTCTPTAKQQTPSTASRGHWDHKPLSQSATQCACLLWPEMSFLYRLAFFLSFFSNLSHENRRLADYHNSPQANCPPEPHASASWQVATFSEISAIISKYRIYISRNGILLLTLASFSKNIEIK